MIQGNLALEKSAVPVSRTRITSSMISVSRQKVKNRIQSLAEAVILQAIEDLFDFSERKKSIDFFKGENFTLCAETAGLSPADQIRIVRMLAKAGLQTVSFWEVKRTHDFRDMSAGMMRKLMAAAELKMLIERDDTMGLKGLAAGIILQSSMIYGSDITGRNAPKGTNEKEL